MLPGIHLEDRSGAGLGDSGRQLVALLLSTTDDDTHVGLGEAGPGE